MVVATLLREEGRTGVHTHFHQLSRYLEAHGCPATILTSFSWGGLLTVPVFAPRFAIDRVSPSLGVAWYRYWHEAFLARALHQRLSGMDEAIIYAQCPVSARAALRARCGPRQRVILVVHFNPSQSDEWVIWKRVRPGDAVYRAIRHMESEVIPQLDGIVYVCRQAREALTGWLPEAASVRSEVIPNFVAPVDATPGPLGDLVTVGSVEEAKNHRFLLDVLAAANRMGSPLSLDVFGEGSCRRDLEHRASALGLDGQVRFRGFRPDVQSFLPGYRAYVHSSTYETFPLAIIEAMAAGLPVVAANVAGIGECCDDGVEGRFWSLDDPDNAAVILLDLLSRETVRASTGAAAASRFRRQFSVDVVGPRLLSFLIDEAPVAEPV